MHCVLLRSCDAGLDSCSYAHRRVEADRELGPAESSGCSGSGGSALCRIGDPGLSPQTTALVLQLLGAIGLIVVVATHFCEALRLFPSMHWGAEHSLGHYLDLGSAVGGFTLFPIGYLLHAFTERKASVARDEAG